MGLAIASAHAAENSLVLGSKGLSQAADTEIPRNKLPLCAAVLSCASDTPRLSEGIAQSAPKPSSLASVLVTDVSDSP